MKKTLFSHFIRIFLVIIVFSTISFLLTYNVVMLPSLVIGDNFYWTEQTILDVLGPRAIRESFLGDVAIVSTFKSGFLFPLGYVFILFNAPFSIIYPFLLYFFSMLSFYLLSIEFLKKKWLAFIISTLYVVNPITPYYFASIQNAFVLVFLPLILKFFARSLYEIEWPLKQSYLSKNVMLTAFFLALSVSAHEQFLLSAILIALCLVITYVFVFLRNHGLGHSFIRFLMTTFATFFLIFLLVNLPLFISLFNVSKAPMSSYFSGRFNDFMENVRYTYSNVNFATLLRFGGDSGVGLGHASWYDSNAPMNLLGYSIFTVFLFSILLLIVQRRSRKDKAFFKMNILLFIFALVALWFIKYLPSNRPLAKMIFNFVIQTWESPIKIRIVLLIAALTTSLITFRTLENLSSSMKERIFSVLTIFALMLSVFTYNSPWLIEYAGYTPLQQIADHQKWGLLFDGNYSKIANFIEQNFKDRGIIVPYTHKEELYVPPNFRLFQLVSKINERMSEITEGPNVPWSGIFGLLSVKYVILNEYIQENEIQIFPNSINVNSSSLAKYIKNDPGFKLEQSLGNFTIFENQNTLPLLYATNYYVFYDDIATLKYTLQLVNFTDLPAFIETGGNIGQISVPEYIGEYNYKVYSLSPHNASVSNQLLTITHRNGSMNSFILNKTSVFNGIDVFSAVIRLFPGDNLEIAGLKECINALDTNELILNSTSFSLGEHASFTLNFTVNILQRGFYSFLGPRVIFDVGNLKQYYLIFHDNGIVELAILYGSTFLSGIKYNVIGYDLTREEKSINVSVSRIWDKVRVFVNGNLAMSFNTGEGISKVYLASDFSTSKFTDISIKTLVINRLFVARQVESPLVFYPEQASPERAKLIVSNVDSDYAVVLQYLNTPIRVLNVKNHAVTTNIFFSGWIINRENYDQKEIVITIQVTSLNLTLGLTLLSIASTYAIIILIVFPVAQKKTISVVFKLLNRLKQNIKHLRKGCSTNE
ncbi:MAG: hypothetical protein QXE05_00885 [Nitrososphaeria archaeon]